MDNSRSIPLKEMTKRLDLDYDDFIWQLKRDGILEGEHAEQDRPQVQTLRG